MANFYDVAQAIQQPNIVGSFNQGVQTAQRNNLYNEQQQVFQRQQAQQQQLQNLAPQVIAGDPNAFAQAAAIDPDRAEKYQGSRDQQLLRLRGALTYLKKMQASGNPAAMDAAYQQAKPFLSQIAGKPAPDHWDPSFEAGLDQAVASIDETSLKNTPSGFQQFALTAKAAGLQPGTPEYEQAANIALGREGRASNAGIGFQKIIGADGRERIGRTNPRNGVFEVLDEATGQFEPLGAPAAPAPGAPANTSPMMDFATLARTTGATMTSGLRSGERNAEVGGVPNSQHIAGTAADFAVNPAQKSAFIAQAQAMGYKAIDEGDHVHLQEQRGPSPTGLAVARSPEDTAAAVEAAKQSVQLGFLPKTEAVKTDAAVNQARETAIAKNDVEKWANLPKNKAAVAASTADLDRLADAAKEVLAAPGLDRITGIPGALPNIPGSDAANAQAKLDALTSQVGFSVLQNMRNNSPTGGALGQVSDRENEMLQNNLAALSRKQSGAEYRKQLQKIIDYAEGSKERRVKAFDAEYANPPPPASRVGGLAPAMNQAPASIPGQQAAPQATQDFSHLWSGQ